MSDLLDWQITDAPSFDEALTTVNVSSPADQLARALPALSPRDARRLSVMLGGVIVLVLTSVGLYRAWNHAHLRIEIKQVIARENEADQMEDWQALRDLVADPGLADWRTQFYAIPPPLPYLAPTWSDELKAITPIESNLVRAEVVYHYRAPDGTSLTFIRDQYYRYLNRAWKRAESPADIWQETLDFESAHFIAGYAAEDEAFVKPALLEAEAHLARVCAHWPCADVPEIKLSFSATTYPPEYPTYEASSKSLFYQTFLEADGYERTLTWPALHHSGYALDDTTRQWYQRTLALSLFQRLTNQLALTHDLDERSVLARALALRLATRLGLETFPLNEVWVTQPAYTLSELWAGRTAQGGKSNAYLWDPNVALRAALVALNRLLRDQPPEVDDRLLAALLDTTAVADWVARGLGISHYEAQTQLAGLAQAKLPAVQVLTSQPTTFILGCSDGPYAFSPNQGAPTHLLEGAYLSASVYGWSPDGRRLLVELNGQVGVINFESHTLTWLPLTGTNDYHALRWVNNTQVILINYNSHFSPMQFIDLLQPARPISVLEGALDYFRAPDSSMGIVVQPATNFSAANSRLALISSPEERARPIAEGDMLAWSPDNRYIAYLSRGQKASEFALRLTEIQTGATRDLLTDTDLLTTAEDRTAIDYPPWATAQWTPDSQRLVFSVSTFGSHGPRSWVGLISITMGSTWEPLSLENPVNAYLAGLSADGRWLAIVVSGSLPFSSPQMTTRLYSATTGQPERAFPKTNFLGWSPTGHQLALWDDKTSYLLDNPDQQAEPPTPLTHLPCLNLIWNPNP